MGWLLKNNPSNPPNGCKAIGDGWIGEHYIINDLKINKKFKKRYKGKNVLIAIIKELE